MGKRTFLIGVIKVEVAHETGSLSLIRGEISFFFGFFFYSSTSYQLASMEMLLGSLSVLGFTIIFSR